MSWRTVVISNRCKLDLKLGYLVVRGEETKRIFLDEIALLMIENTAVSITGCLIAALTEKKIRVVFCDGKRNPAAELTPYYGCHDCSLKVRSQIGWSDSLRGAVWTEIVTEKIHRQMDFLADEQHEKEAEMLQSYLDEIEYNDETNREGHAAKVYFNAIFGMRFSRSDSENVTNAALNYGYGLILSAVNREVASNGYLTQLGLFHDNMFNPYNLSCDLMEPFRVIVDRKVKAGNYTVFETEQKRELISLLNDTVVVDSSSQNILNGIKLYVKSVFDALNAQDVSLIKFAKYEL